MPYDTAPLPSPTMHRRRHGKPHVPKPFPLSGGGGHHHHHGGGGRFWGGPGPWYPVGLPTIVEDPCTTPWLYPPGTCAQILAAQRGMGDAGAYQNARRMNVSLERVEGLGGSCCAGCASGAQCSGGMGDFTGSSLVTYAVLGGLAILAYHAFMK